MHTIKKTVLIIIGALSLFVSCTTNQNVKKSTNLEPKWLMNPRLVYDEVQYISAVGSGLTKDIAEKSAFTSLVAIFGQRIQGETTVNERYTEALKKGAITVSEDTDLSKTITTSVDMDFLVGAEIKDLWFDGVKTYYAVAVMDKIKATILYSNLIEANEQTITQLTDVAQSEKNTLDSYARFDFARSIALANEDFTRVLSVINSAAGMSKKASIRSSASLKLDCVAIAQAIPIYVEIVNDTDGRISSAFKSILSNQGFKMGGENSPYAVQGVLDLSPVEFSQNENKFSRYIIKASLLDSSSGKILMPFSVDGREGHASQEEANNRAIKKASQRIESEFGIAFGSYLTQLTEF